ncbi:MAG: magnesium transporter [Mycobacterium sp.]|jgi:magnesium transporter|nr:magnesium transporter [Mycobacterium sp.]
MVDCGVYVDGHRLPGTHSLVAARAKVRELVEGFVWVGLHEPDADQMREVAEVFGLHRLAAEDAVRAHQRPKVERYDDTVVLVLKTVKYIPHESISKAPDIVGTGEIVIFVGPDFVVTVRHGDFSGLTGVRKEMDADPHHLRLGPFAIMHAIADHVVDDYRDVSLRVETDIDAMEEQIISPRSTTDVDQIYLLKREILELRRAVNPLSDALHEIVSEYQDLIGKEVLRYLRDVIDHQTMAAERINTYDELLTSLVTAALARTSMQQNLDLRKISAWVAIASVPTMLAAIFGMNFEHMPELRWTWGYPAALGVMATVCMLLYRTFRRNHWL